MTRLRCIRKLKDLTQIEVCERTGFKLQKYRMIERGATEPTDEDVKIIAEALGVDVEEVKEIFTAKKEERTAPRNFGGEKTAEKDDIDENQDNFESIFRFLCAAIKTFMVLCGKYNIDFTKLTVNAHRGKSKDENCD